MKQSNKILADSVKKQEEILAEYIEHFKKKATGKLSPAQIGRIIQEIHDVKIDEDTSDSSDSDEKCF